MTALIATIIIVLLVVIILQIAKVTELSKRIRGEEESELRSNDRTALWLVIFMIAFLIFCVASAIYYKNVMLGYGPHQAASAHGGELDSLFNTTLFFTGIVFILTQILTFWYAFKYRFRKGAVGKFISHDTNLELIWTGIPAVVMTFLVVQGLMVWNDVMPDLDPESEYLEIEATGYQFAWEIRYPGPDGLLGTKNFRKIVPGVNNIGQDWTDEKNVDDVLLSGSDLIVLPVDTTVRVRITSRDVLHNFYLPHFRVKMDAIPGLPTYFIFKPTLTTEEYRNNLKEYSEWQVPTDPSDPESKMRWEDFDFELACAELCGKGHYSMRRVLKIVTREEYAAWEASQKSFYLNNIRGTENDPEENRDKLFGPEISQRKTELTADIENALIAEDASKIIQLKHVFYETAGASLDKRSQYELDHLADLMNKYSDLKVQLAGHTDSIGDDEMNMNLSQSRAANVLSYLLNKGIDASRLTAKGYGELEPIDSNDSPEGRQVNRRTELRIVS